MDLPTVDADRFWRDGFLLLRSVLSLEEIERLRNEAIARSDHKGDVLSHPRVGYIIYDDRILHVAKTILGETPIYFGDSAVSFGEASHGYHKDNSDRYDAKAPDWNGRYPLIRVGVYLQDHSAHSGGLNLRVGSHLIPNANIGQNLYMGTRPGDVVVWNLRTSHSGNGKLLRFPKSLQLEPRTADKLPRWLFAPTSGERIALFMCYAAESRHLDRYIRYMKTRTYAVNIWNQSHYGDSVWDAIQNKDLKVWDMRAKIQNEPNVGCNRDYAPIPY